METPESAETTSAANANGSNDRIRPLEAEIVRKIAAGEVIHQPLNAVKELIENALDAKSTHVVIGIEDGGYGEISIRDNGAGIHPEDAHSIANRFHTSKLRNKESMDCITTLGFRGEALSSIALIGKLTIISKRKENETGLRIVVQGHERDIQVEHNLENGTTIIASNLFSNYSRSDVKKSVYKISNLISAYAMANPGIKLVLNIPATIFRTPNGSGSDHAQWIGEILGGKPLCYREIHSRNPPFHSELFFTELKQVKPGTGNGRMEMTAFVNKRLVAITSLESVIRNQLEAADLRCEHVVALFQVDPSLLDVHVSPTKEFVTLRNSDAVMEIVAEEFQQSIRSRFEETSASAVKVSETASPCASAVFHRRNPASSTTAAVSPSQKIRFDCSQSLIDPFVNASASQSFIFEDSLVGTSEGDGDANGDDVVHRQDAAFAPLVEQLREELKDCHENVIRDAQMPRLVFMEDLLTLLFQHRTTFYVVPFREVVEEFFYQRLLLGVCNFSNQILEQQVRISIGNLLINLFHDASDAFLQAKLRWLFDSVPHLDDYFSITFEKSQNEDLILLTAPALLPELPVPWMDIALGIASLPPRGENETQWLSVVLRTLASAYAAPLFRTTDANDDVVKHWNAVILPQFKDFYLPGPAFFKSVYSGNNTDLYQSFGRC